MGLTSAIVFGATEGALAKLLGVPLVLLLAWLAVRVNRGAHRRAGWILRDTGFIAGSVIAGLLITAVVVASLQSGVAPRRAGTTSGSGVPTTTPSDTPSASTGRSLPPTPSSRPSETSPLTTTDGPTAPDGYTRIASIEPFAGESDAVSGATLAGVEQENGPDVKVSVEAVRDKQPYTASTVFVTVGTVKCSFHRVRTGATLRVARRGVFYQLYADRIDSLSQFILSLRQPAPKYGERCHRS